MPIPLAFDQTRSASWPSSGARGSRTRSPERRAPTASLDAANRAAVVELIEARKRAGAAIVGIFHDEDVRDRVADRVIDVTKFATEAPSR